MKQIMSGGQPFFISGGKTGCLLLHGFTGTPNEMRWLGEYLAGRGFTVLAPRLYAHGTKLADMPRARWGDWVASAEDGYHYLEGTCSQIVAVGLSMGGVLALLLSSYLPVAGVIAMSAPHVMPDRRMRVLRPIIPALSKLWRFQTKGPSDFLDSFAEQVHVDYEGYPVRGVNELNALIAEMRKNLVRNTKPALLIYSKGDLSVVPEHGHAIHQALPSKDKQILMLDRSGHVVTRDVERQRVFKAAGDFIQRVAGVES